MFKINGIEFELIDVGPICRWVDVVCMEDAIINCELYKKGERLQYFLDESDELKFSQAVNPEPRMTKKSWDDMSLEEREQEARRILHLCELIQEGKVIP